MFLAFTLLFNGLSVFADTGASKSKDLDNIFVQLEKYFLAAEREDKKITDKQVQAAAQRKLNEVKAAVEMTEEKLGALTQDEYKQIALQLTEQMYRSTKYWVERPYAYWNDDNLVEMQYNVEYLFDDIDGAINRMGKAKDEVDPADFTKVKAKLQYYIQKSVQQGNRFTDSITKNLPGEVEKLVLEEKPSKIVLARSMADFYDMLLNVNLVSFDGTESMDAILEHFQIYLEINKDSREREIPYESYVFPSDLPSEDSKEEIVSMLVDGEISDAFSFNFKQNITLGELARLYFEKHEYFKEEDLEKIELEKGLIGDDQPDYIKQAYAYGLINSDSNLNKPLTRLEAARLLTKFRGDNSSLNEGYDASLPIYDYKEIAETDRWAVSNALDFMNTRDLYFAPQALYTREEAIVDRYVYQEWYSKIRGLVPVKLWYDVKKVIIGKDTIDIRFDNKGELAAYLGFAMEPLEDMEIGSGYTRLDMGYALLELYTPENGIKFTFKKGVDSIDFEEGVYGPELLYYMEPKVLKTGDTIDMTMKPDATTEGIFKKLDAILAQTVKSGMTTEQKVKAIHDYVVKHITYDSGYMSRIQDFKSILTSIDKGRGVCMDYSLLFQYLCKRAAIPCITESGNVSFTNIPHAWNVVYLNGDWKFVDCTFNDGESAKNPYRYYLKSRQEVIGSHTIIMGNPELDKYPDINPMNIQSQDELRVYVNRKDFYPVLTFKIAGNKFKPDMSFMKFVTLVDSYNLKYDDKTALYTLTMK